MVCFWFVLQKLIVFIKIFRLNGVKNAICCIFIKINQAYLNYLNVSNKLS